MKDQLIITGATGFVGQNLVPYLEDKDYLVNKVSRNVINSKSISYDILNKNDLNKCKAFIHLAGKAHDLKNVSKPEEYFNVNTELTKQVFDIFLDSDCEVFIFISSVKAVQDHLDGVLTEDMEAMPKSPYGQSKLAAEEYILNMKIPDNKRVYVLRPCMIHGPNNKGNLNLLYKIVKQGIPSPFGLFNNKRSFVSIANFCYIIEELLLKMPSSDVFNVADDESYSINELMQIISESLSKKSTIIKVPKFIIKIIANIGDLISFLPLNSERLEKMTENYRVSNLKILNTLNIVLPVTAKEGLKSTIQSFKK